MNIKRQFSLSLSLFSLLLFFSTECSSCVFCCCQETMKKKKFLSFCFSIFLLILSSSFFFSFPQIKENELFSSSVFSREKKRNKRKEIFCFSSGPKDCLLLFQFQNSPENEREKLERKRKNILRFKEREERREKRDLRKKREKGKRNLFLFILKIFAILFEKEPRYKKEDNLLFI